MPAFPPPTSPAFGGRHVTGTQRAHDATYDASTHPPGAVGRLWARRYTGDSRARSGAAAPRGARAHRPSVVLTLRRDPSTSAPISTDTTGERPPPWAVGRYSRRHRWCRCRRGGRATQRSCRRRRLRSAPNAVGGIREAWRHPHRRRRTRGTPSASADRPLRAARRRAGKRREGRRGALERGRCARRQRTP